MKLGELAKQLDCPAEGDLGIDILGLAALSEAGPGELSFLDSEKHLHLLKSTRATALILPPTLAAPGVPCLRSEQPRLTFARALALFYPPRRPAPGIHPTAVLGRNVRLGEGVYLGPHTVVGDDVEIGEGAIVYANCTLYDDVQIGARTLIHANCVVHERTRIGADCVLQAGAVIGAEGHGFVPMADGSWHRMPQVGHVVIEDGVEVGANSTVDRPATGVTRLGRGTKLDNLVMVGHGCQIDENCMLIAQVGLGGGVKIGRNVVLAGQVGVADHVSIGERTVATAKTGIPGNIEAGALVSGYPAIPHNIWLRASAVLRKLPELHQSVRDLQRRLAALQQRLDT